MKKRLLSIALCLAVLASFLALATPASAGYSGPPATTFDVFIKYAGWAEPVLVHHYTQAEFLALSNSTTCFFMGIDSSPTEVRARVTQGVTLSTLLNDARSYNADCVFESGGSLNMVALDNLTTSVTYDSLLGTPRYYYYNYTYPYPSDLSYNPADPVESVFAIASRQGRNLSESDLESGGGGVPAAYVFYYDLSHDEAVAGTTYTVSKWSQATWRLDVCVTKSAPDYSQKWYLDNLATGPIMEKSGSESGSVSVVKNSPVMWLSDQPASQPVVFPAGGIWKANLASSGWGGSKSTCSVQVGDWDGNVFSAFNPTPLIGTKSGSTFIIEVPFGGTVQAGHYLALIVYNSTTSGSVVTDGSSYLQSPSNDPGFPLPELSAGILLSLGLAGMGGFIVIKRRNTRATG